jgi:hypothetical protein
MGIRATPSSEEVASRRVKRAPSLERGTVGRENRIGRIRSTMGKGEQNGSWKATVALASQQLASNM